MKARRQASLQRANPRSREQVIADMKARRQASLQRAQPQSQYSATPDQQAALGQALQLTGDPKKDFMSQYKGPLDKQLAWNLSQAGGQHLQQAEAKAGTPRTASGIARSTLGQTPLPADPLPAAQDPRTQSRYVSPTPTGEHMRSVWNTPTRMSDQQFLEDSAWFGSGPLTRGEIDRATGGYYR
jgi:hypothetical protein